MLGIHLQLKTQRFLALGLLLGLLGLADFATAAEFNPDGAWEAVDDVDRHHHQHVDKCAPLEVHLALAEDSNSMKLAWRTKSENCDSRLSYGRLEEGQALGASVSAESNSYQVNQDDMCTRPARTNDFQAVMHVALMEDLLPGQMYWFELSGGKQYNFRAPLPAGDDSKFSFIAFGDMGESWKSRKSGMAQSVVDRIAEEMDREEVPLILHVGDLAYADGKPKVWDSFMKCIEPVASKAAYMVAIGNHEMDYIGGSQYDPSGVESYHPYWGNFGDDSGGECGSMTARRFAMPAGASNLAARRRTSAEAAANAPLNHTAIAAAAAARIAELKKRPSSRKLITTKAGGVGETAGKIKSSGKGYTRHRHDDEEDVPYDNPPFWYSFDYGLVHFTTISTEHDLEQGSPQYRWLEAEFEAVDRCKTPWLAVIMHRPMYVLYPHKSNRVVGEHLREFLEDLYLDYKVDFTLSGHVHSYSRTCDVSNQRCTSDGSGITHFVIGTGGHELSFLEDAQKEWGSAMVVEHGVVRFDVNRDEMKVQFITASDGRVADETTLVANIYSKEECRKKRKS